MVLITPVPIGARGVCETTARVVRNIFNIHIISREAAAAARTGIYRRNVYKNNNNTRVCWCARINERARV